MTHLADSALGVRTVNVLGNALSHLSWVGCIVTRYSSELQADMKHTCCMLCVLLSPLSIRTTCLQVKTDAYAVVNDEDQTLEVPYCLHPSWDAFRYIALQ